MFRARSGSRHGVVLIVVLGVLVVLALLATAFATLQSVERNVSRNYLDTVRARLLAMSGIEVACDRLSSLAERGDLNDASFHFWGKNVTETGIPDWNARLEDAANPSFAYEEEAVQNPYDVNVRPLLFGINGKNLGVSGFMSSGTYARNGDIYRLRVTDCNSMINVNDGMENGERGYVSQNLRRILNNLGDLVGVKIAGDKILQKRPARGYVSRRELEVVLGRDDYERLRAFITVVSWTDSNVANPVPLSPETLSAYPVKYNEQLGIYRYGRSFGAGGNSINLPLRFAPDFADPAGVNHAIMALDELNAQWIEICRRSPVNVNAAPREVLTALMIGLRGVFMVERRKHNPDGSLYAFLNHLPYDNEPAGRRGDEYGYLYATVPFLRADETVADGGIVAARVVEEIIACRTRQKSPGLRAVDYRSVWYGGPFRSWRQWNSFCDGLVTGGLFADDRPIYYEYDPVRASGSPSGSDILIRSSLQAKLASQALADVLKANFNPNLTLNELNPDQNIHTLVDKTDLLSSSTEFCFTPMGVFEIESEGLVIATDGNIDFMSARKGRTVARKKIACSVKVYDAYRESSQADFYLSASRPGAGAVLDQNRTMIVGPEPAVENVAKECRWSGWIQLSTVGGPSGHAGPELSDSMHGHFAPGMALHYHAGGVPNPLRTAGGEYRNNPDRTEGGQPGPYEPTLGPGGRYRLARDWEQLRPPTGADYRAPSDLRHDGAYVERDSALLWENGEDVLDLVGTVAYWIKPSFRPEMTGKPRTYFVLDRYLPGNPARRPQFINGHWFLAAQDSLAGGVSQNENRPPVYSGGPWRPTCFLAGFSCPFGGVGTESLSLNHNAHSDEAKTDLLGHHTWIHAAYHYNMNSNLTRLIINGRIVPPGADHDIRVHPRLTAGVADFAPAPIRIGEPSKTMVENIYGRNWSADSTIDEFYLWKGDRVAEAQSLYSRGRYYLPRRGKEAVFDSRPMPLEFLSQRGLPTASAIRPPGEPGIPPSRPGGTPTVTDARPGIWILGAAWTMYPEWVDERGQAMVWDLQGQDDQRRGNPLQIQVELTFVVNGNGTKHRVKDDLTLGMDEPLRVDRKDQVQYRFVLGVPEAGLDTALLGTPIIDDVTIFYTTGREFLSFESRDIG